MISSFIGQLQEIKAAQQQIKGMNYSIIFDFATESTNSRRKLRFESLFGFSMFCVSRFLIFPVDFSISQRSDCFKTSIAQTRTRKCDQFAVQWRSSRSMLQHFPIFHFSVFFFSSAPLCIRNFFHRQFLCVNLKNWRARCKRMEHDRLVAEMLHKSARF